MCDNYTARIQIDLGPFPKGIKWDDLRLEAFHDAIADLVFEKDWFPESNVSPGMSGLIFEDDIYDD